MNFIHLPQRGRSIGYTSSIGETIKVSRSLVSCFKAIAGAIYIRANLVMLYLNPYKLKQVMELIGDRFSEDVTIEQMSTHVDLSPAHSILQ